MMFHALHISSDNTLRNNHIAPSQMIVQEDLPRTLGMQGCRGQSWGQSSSLDDAHFKETFVTSDSSEERKKKHMKKYAEVVRKEQE